jgi:Fe-S-cluster-containing hydrogenase component 2
MGSSFNNQKNKSYALARIIFFIKRGGYMAVKIDPDVCGHIENCPVQGLCIKLCEQGAIIEEDGDVKVVPENCDDCDLCIQNCPNQAISKA